MYEWHYRDALERQQEWLREAERERLLQSGCRRDQWPQQLRKRTMRRLGAWLMENSRD